MNSASSRTGLLTLVFFGVLFFGACSKDRQEPLQPVASAPVFSPTHTGCVSCTATLTSTVTHTATETHTASVTPTPSPSLTPTHTPDAFSIVVFPDTQSMVESYPEIWEGMAQWVADNKTDRNVIAVIGVGDITSVPSTSQYAEGVKGWDLVKNAGVIYVPAIGNHDYDGGIPKNREATLYNQHFGPPYFSGKSWYGANYNGSNENYYAIFSAHGNDYLAFSLEQFPRDEVLVWAQGIVDANHGKKMILVTHSYLNCDGTRVLFGDSIMTTLLGRDATANDAQMVWDKFIRVNPEIFLVISGHMTGIPKCSYSTDANDAGKAVHQFYVNYQDAANGGNGYMAILRFQPPLGKITATVYSDYLKAYAPGIGFTMDEEF